MSSPPCSGDTKAVRTPTTMTKANAINNVMKFIKTNLKANDARQATQIPVVTLRARTA
jgi:hypothetical protein